MKLFHAIDAYLAAKEMSKERWPFEVSYALVKVSKEFSTEAELFRAEELKLVKQYCVPDKNGNYVMDGGKITFKDDGESVPAYRREIEELKNMEVKKGWKPLSVAAPDEIKPEWILALDEVINFTVRDD